jgi:hypothetical protein
MSATSSPPSWRSSSILDRGAHLPQVVNSPVRSGWSSPLPAHLSEPGTMRGCGHRNAAETIPAPRYRCVPTIRLALEHNAAAMVAVRRHGKLRPVMHEHCLGVTRVASSFEHGGFARATGPRAGRGLHTAATPPAVRTRSDVGSRAPCTGERQRRHPPQASPSRHALERIQHALHRPASSDASPSNDAVIDSPRPHP